MTFRRARHGLALVVLLTSACTRGDDPTIGGGVPVPSATTSQAPSGSASPGGPASTSPQPSRSPADPATAYPRQRLTWRGCSNGFQCATLKVPLDYTKQSGRKIDVSVIRLPATGGASRRIGSVVLNPGGPGGSGVDFARQARDLLPAAIRSRFDVVSFDPRGVARSTPVDCVGHRELDRILGADPAPDDAAEKQRLIDVNRELARGCERRSGRDLLAHVGTVDVVRDVEVLRNALGDRKLTYVGFSYGTVIGGLYAAMFPDRVRALVLDGAVDLRASSTEASLQQAKGFETALDAFLDWCAGASSCGFRRQGDDLPRAYDELVARIDRSPLPTRDSGRKLGAGEVGFGVAAGLYSREWGWPALARGLTEAADGDGTTLLALFDSLVERRADGTYSNATEALISVACVDSVYPTELSAYERDAERFRREAPRFGEMLAWGALACAYWPVRPEPDPEPFRATGTPPIVVIGTTRDPATPYRWAQAMASQIERAVLVTFDGDGHTAYGYDRSACITRVVNAYLLDLTVPRAGTRCRD